MSFMLLIFSWDCIQNVLHWKSIKYSPEDQQHESLNHEFLPCFIII